MNPKDLNLWVVSRDEPLLRDATWGLSNFDCHVTPFREFISLESLWKFSQPDLLLVDVVHPDVASITRLFQNGYQNFTYTMLLVDPNRPTDHLSGLEGAFHDAIAKPLNGGELLTRIRAGVRFLEFERRMRKLSLVDRTTGLLSRHGLLRKMETELEFLANGEPQEFVLVRSRLDYLDTLFESQDSHTRNRLFEEMSGLIAEITGEEEWTAHLQPDEFAIVIPDSSDEEGEAIAMLLRNRLENHDFVLHGLPLRLTATYCITAWNPMEKSFQNVLAEAERTLDYARSEGGDAIVRSGQLDPIIAAWEEDNWAGGDLTNLTARDVMQPFTTEWRDSDTTRISPAVIRNSGVQCVPCLDKENRYHGILDRDVLEDLASEKGEPENGKPEYASFGSASRRHLSDLVQSPTTVHENLPYAELMEHFTKDREQMLVVLRGNRPLGYITQEVISRLLEPIDKRGYRTDQIPSHQSDYLIIPDMPRAYETPSIAVK